MIFISKFIATPCNSYVLYHRGRIMGRIIYYYTSSDRKKLVHNKKLSLQPLKSGKWHVPNDNFVYFEVY